MRQSNLFTKTRREAPKDETARNAQLLIRAGYIQKMQAGVYSMMPLGLRVIEKIKNIVREEMTAVGGQEVSLASLQEKKLWQTTNRWDDKIVDNWFKTKLANDTEVGLGFTHEEPLTDLMRDHIRSFRDLPTYVYQFQTKFRNEKRAKSGILRSREFLMKDLYSFSRSVDEHDVFYEKMKLVYASIFKKAGIGDRTYLTFASGGSFAAFSHEFQMLTDAGEDTIYIDEEKGIAINEEVNTSDVHNMLNIDPAKLKQAKAVEVGNIFSLGTKFSEPLGLLFQEDGEGGSQPVIMGSYGIGIPRLMGAVVEALADDKGIVWPKSISPFAVHLILVGKSEEAKKRAEEVYEKLTAAGIEVLFDDRANATAGEKFADSDLMGISVRAVVGDKNEKIEVKERAAANDDVKHMTAEEIIKNV